MNKEATILDKNAPINKNRRNLRSSFWLNVAKNMHVNNPAQKITRGDITSKGVRITKNARAKAVKIINLNFILVPIKHSYLFPGLY